MPDEKKVAQGEPKKNSQCPNCGSTNVHPVLNKGFASPWIQCNACGSKWLKG